MVAKNTLFIKALEQTGKINEEVLPSLKGETAIMFANVGKSPAKLIKEFRKANPKPVLKAACVEDCIYLGDAAVEELVNIKSREELIGDIIGLLQSPREERYLRTAGVLPDKKSQGWLKPSKQRG